MVLAVGRKERESEGELASRLAAMSRQTSLTALNAVTRLVKDPGTATAARRVSAVARHLAAAASNLAMNIEAAKQITETGTP